MRNFPAVDSPQGNTWRLGVRLKEGQYCPVFAVKTGLLRLGETGMAESQNGRKTFERIIVQLLNKKNSDAGRLCFFVKKKRQ